MTSVTYFVAIHNHIQGKWQNDMHTREGFSFNNIKMKLILQVFFSPVATILDDRHMINYHDLHLY